MKNEDRKICFDKELQLEAYTLNGVSQTFPNHFHEHYVLGVLEKGQREMICGDVTYTVCSGACILLHPEENHQCKPSGEQLLIYKALNISEKVIREVVKELTGKEFLPIFQKSVCYDEEIAFNFLSLHRMIMEQSKEFEKEEIFLLLMDLLLKRYAKPIEYNRCAVGNNESVDRICHFIEKNYVQNLMLEDICQYAGVSKSTLLRTFTKEKGITPYRYLETIRINQAKKMLEHGVTLLDAAVQTGFSDQSHFTKYFQGFTGITPGAYRRIFTVKEEKDEK